MTPAIAGTLTDVPPTTAPASGITTPIAAPSRRASTHPRPPQAPLGVPLPDLRGIACRLEQVHVRYGGVRALTACSIDLVEGELTVVVGLPGSGRSTLARVVAGIDEVTLGRLWVDGTEAARISEPAAVAQRRRSAALVLGANDIAPRLTAFAHTVASLELDGFCHDHASHLASRSFEHLGLEAIAGRRVYRLPQSQRCRLGLAIALAASPRLIVADDFGVGAEGSGRSRADDRDVAGLLRARCTKTGASALIVSNDPVVAVAADRVIALDEGHLVADRYGSSAGEIVDLVRGLETMAILRG